ncbi:MAG: hypothetical protein ACYC9L_13640 [Sulfuricaulis sp.]
MSSPPFLVGEDGNEEMGPVIGLNIEGYRTGGLSLLDTHLLLWVMAASRKLARGVKSQMLDPRNEIYLQRSKPVGDSY